MTQLLIGLTIYFSESEVGLLLSLESLENETKNILTLSHTRPGFMCLQYKSFENTVGKGEIARNEQFLLFP